MHVHEEQVTAAGEKVILPPEDVPCLEEFKDVSMNLDNEEKTRQFVFAEFFAGMG